MKEKTEAFLKLFCSQVWLMKKYLINLIYISHDPKKNIMLVDPPDGNSFRTTFRIYNSKIFFFDSYIEGPIKQGTVKIDYDREN